MKEGGVFWVFTKAFGYIFIAQRDDQKHPKDVSAAKYQIFGTKAVVSRQRRPFHTRPPTATMAGKMRWGDSADYDDDDDEFEVALPASQVCAGRDDLFFCLSKMICALHWLALWPLCV